MPIDTAVASKIWLRYAFARDNGHSDFIKKADLCDRYFCGDQWDPMDLAKLKASRRPALTINKIISTMSNVFGEQIYNRSEIAYQPKSGSPSEVAEALTKVARHISDNNQLNWKRSDMFVDGCITSRGFLDMRLSFNDSMQGDIVFENINPKNVIIDPDAEHYDPDTWNEVFVTKWMTADDIAIFYNKEDAELLRNREQSFFPYGYDSIQAGRDRFGDRFNPMYNGTYDESSVMRNLRVIERQHRLLDRQKHFVVPDTGEMRPVPAEFTRDRIAWFVEKFGFQVTTKLVHRIKWTVICDNVLLHEDWSPYKHFTVIPFFPFFRYGKTVGMVENLVGPQELLNKVSSQELHVVNTTANSGWKVKTGALATMSIEELEQRGAETGLVVEYTNSPDDIEKITPNAVPTGLDRISYKAEEHIKTISGVPDSVQGQAREDVAAKAIQANRQAASTNQAKPMDSLARTDFIIARNMLDIVQEYYTEPRTLSIIKDDMTGEKEDVSVNQQDVAGAIINDLTLGEYGITVVSVPQRMTLEDSQFEQALSMRKEGIAIPDDILIENSRLFKKGDIVKKMRAQAESPEAKAAAELQTRTAAAEATKIENEAQVKAADAGLRVAKTQQVTVDTQKEAATPPDTGDGGQAEAMKAQAEVEREDRKFEHEKQLDIMRFNHEVEMADLKAKQDADIAADKAATDRSLRIQSAAQAASKPKQGQSA
jgi:hypothetical protein